MHDCFLCLKYCRFQYVLVRCIKLSLFLIKWYLEDCALNNDIQKGVLFCGCCIGFRRVKMKKCSLNNLRFVSVQFIDIMDKS